jgi:hypothetical protein
MTHRTVKLALPALLALTAGCTTMGTGFGSTASGADSVAFSWKSSGADPVTGTMNATLADGQTYSGQFFEITKDTRVENLGPLWSGWRPGL